MIAEELDRLITEHVERRVKEVLASQHVQASLAQRLQVCTTTNWWLCSSSTVACCSYCSALFIWLLASTLSL